ncbi:MAG: NIPSNAP family containing protein [Chloroflexi bacterium]|nr:MAG: NIPSNAP family containing protein [Chloroflexota bacterium]
MLFELRQYRMKPGQQQRWVQLMEEEIIPFQVSKGMVVVASFIGEQDDSAYVWIRRFDSEAERDRLYKAVYESDYWKNEIAPQVGDLIDRSQTVVTRLTPTPLSVIR